MKKTLISTVVAAALAGSAFGALATSDSTSLKGFSVEQKNAIEAYYLNCRCTLKCFNIFIPTASIFDVQTRGLHSTCTALLVRA